ncbi:MAG: hypothetical protein D6727_03355 [Gammaproteobacteria bacterium]|nr:MAG: hypothetical protein D6727_03355 [Gammaproteobacteria bacterium]
MAPGRNFSGGLETVRNLEEFFRDSLDAAAAANRVTLDSQTMHYVVNLLTLFSRSESFYEPGPDGPRLRPLALMLADAMDAASEEERNFALQRIGDVALFVAGLFADSLRRAAVDVDYYVYMGGGAYQSLAGSLRGTLRGRLFGEVFTELSAKFALLVDVLQEMRAASRGSSHEDALRLYELWVKTGSPRAERLLRAYGIQPLSQARSRYQH